MTDLIYPNHILSVRYRNDNEVWKDHYTIQVLLTTASEMFVKYDDGGPVVVRFSRKDGAYIDKVQCDEGKGFANPDLFLYSEQLGNDNGKVKDPVREAIDKVKNIQNYEDFKEVFGDDANCIIINDGRYNYVLNLDIDYCEDGWMTAGCRNWRTLGFALSHYNEYYFSDGDREVCREIIQTLNDCEDRIKDAYEKTKNNKPMAEEWRVVHGKGHGGDVGGCLVRTLEDWPAQPSLEQARSLYTGECVIGYYEVNSDRLVARYPEE